MQNKFVLKKHYKYHLNLKKQIAVKRHIYNRLRLFFVGICGKKGENFLILKGKKNEALIFAKKTVRKVGLQQQSNFSKRFITALIAQQLIIADQKGFYLKKKIRS